MEHFSVAIAMFSHLLPIEKHLDRTSAPNRDAYRKIDQINSLRFGEPMKITRMANIRATWDGERCGLRQSTNISNVFEKYFPSTIIEEQVQIGSGSNGSSRRDGMQIEEDGDGEPFDPNFKV